MFDYFPVPYRHFSRRLDHRYASRREEKGLGEHYKLDPHFDMREPLIHDHDHISIVLVPVGSRTALPQTVTHSLVRVPHTRQQALECVSEIRPG